VAAHVLTLRYLKKINIKKMARGPATNTPWCKNVFSCVENKKNPDIDNQDQDSSLIKNEHGGFTS